MLPRNTSIGCCAIKDICPKLRSNCPIVLSFCSEHGSITAVLCAKIQNDWITHKQIVGKRDFARFGFDMSFGRRSYIAQHRVHSTCPGLFHRLCHKRLHSHSGWHHSGCYWRRSHNYHKRLRHHLRPHQLVLGLPPGGSCRNHPGHLVETCQKWD